jgi:hypothetical protein
MHANSTTCRVGSNTHVVISMYVCTCTCMSTTQHIVLGPTPYVIISMYVCSYRHMNSATCRAAFNTTCCDQHVCSFVHACQQHRMSCPVQHHTSTTRQIILSTYALTKKSDLHLSLQYADVATYQLGRCCDLSTRSYDLCTWSMVRPINLVDGTTHGPG